MPEKEPELEAWSEKITFGIASIDAQHKQLFDLAASFSGNGDDIRVIKTLVILSQYIREHLREEEALLEESAYPGLAGHRQLHRQFREMLAALLESARRMSLDEIASAVQRLINGWFYQHILTVDAAYVDHLRRWERENSRLGEPGLPAANSATPPSQIKPPRALLGWRLDFLRGVRPAR